MLDPTVYFVAPDSLDDPERVSGGNVYDRRVRDQLRSRGWSVRMLPVAAQEPSEAARALSGLPAGSLVLIDGLIAMAASVALGRNAMRLRVVVLAHMVASAMPGIADAAGAARREREALRTARRVIATSAWTRSELIARGLADADRIAVARPGADAAPMASGSASGRRLLCLGAVAAHKGQDVLVDALAGMADLPGWSCAIAGSLDAEPGFAARTAAAIVSAGLGGRVSLSGVLAGRALDDAYDAADLLVAPSRSESYGMAVAEALARGIPVVAARVGGLPESVAGSPGAVLVPPDDPQALRAVLRRWHDDERWRAELKAAAAASRTAARSWADTAELVAAALSRAASPETTMADAVAPGWRHAG